jgi:Family of unknown function (DUF490).
MALRSQDRAVGTLQLDASYEDLALGLDATLTHTEGGTLTAEGTVPTDLRLQAPSPVDVGARPVRLDLSTERFPLDWVDPFLDPATIRDVRGVLAADVSVGGTLEDPDLDGTASLTDGGATLPSLDDPLPGAPPRRSASRRTRSPSKRPSSAPRTTGASRQRASSTSRS